MDTLSASRESNLTSALLILVLSLALALGVVCLLVVVHFLRATRRAHRREFQRHRPLPRDRRFYSPLLPVPSRWLAIRTEDLPAVQLALGVLKPKPCSWEEGLSAVQDRKLFISPSLDGWILVMGTSLPDPADDVDKCYHFILALSRRLGTVQFFSANRALDHHAWVQANHGRIQRAYAWAGKTLWNQGRMTKAEMDLRLKCFDYLEAAESVFFSQSDPTAFNTQRVPLLAARWSIDPASIGARMAKETAGIAGEPSRSRKH